LQLINLHVRHVEYDASLLQSGLAIQTNVFVYVTLSCQSYFDSIEVF